MRATPKIRRPSFSSNMNGSKAGMGSSRLRQSSRSCLEREGRVLQLMLLLLGILVVLVWYNASGNTDTESKSLRSRFHIFNGATPLVTWHGLIWCGGGYGVEALSYLFGIHDAEHPKFDIAAHQMIADPNRNFIKTLSHDRIVDVLDMTYRFQNHGDPDTISICHFTPADSTFAQCSQDWRSEYVIARTMLETDSLDEGWVRLLNQVDEVWVPASFNLQTFKDFGVKSTVTVVPEIIDADAYDPDITEAWSKSGVTTSKTTIFTTMLDWNPRKNFEATLKGYFKAFTSDDDTVLLVKTNDHPDVQKDYGNLVDELVKEHGYVKSRLPTVEIISGMLDQGEMNAVYKAGTAFVSTSHGEGWGRHNTEAMAMGVPIIAPYWSAPTEYMTDANSYKLKLDGLVPAWGDHKWADPSVDHLVQLLRRVHNNHAEAKRKGKQARRDMVEKYNSRVITKLVVDRIDSILDGLGY